jgi:UDPglucose 6-dehydrogenase
MKVNITMVGVGYVGLVTGACFAELGHDIVCVDKDEAKINTLQKGGIPIFEPGLEELVTRNVKAGRIRFSTDVAGSVKGRDVVFIAVGTPSEKESGRADLRYVRAAAAEVGANIDRFTVIVTKSTVPVGTNAEVARIVAQNIKADVGFGVASNPEFLREGAAISDFMEPDRVVVGVEDHKALKIMEAIYAPLTAQNRPLVVTNIKTAEMIKYAANAFLATKVSFINEIADLCEAVGADIDELARGIGLDHRIGSAFLRTGPGWGGSCFPKDTIALHITAQDENVPVSIVASAISANDRRKSAMADRVAQACGGSLQGKRVGVLGLTFKGQTDDMRDSPALVILPRITEAGAKVVAFDPSNPHGVDTLLPMIELVDSPEAAARDADVLVVVTDWMIFKTYDLEALAREMKTPILVDLRNIYSAGRAIEAGFTAYHGLGRPPRRAAHPTLGTQG